MNGTPVRDAPVHPQAAGDGGGGPPWIDLACTPAAARRARAWTRAVVAGWGLGHLTDDAELVVSELVANAVQASPAASTGNLVRVCLAAVGTGLLIQVRDNCAAFPVRRHTGDMDEDGRGLMIVDQIAAEVGWYRGPDMPGKVVWCLLAGDPAPGAW